MSLTDQDIPEVIESSLYMPVVPRKLKALTIPGITGHYSRSVSSGFINRVGQARLTAENADATISAVRDFFARRNQSFGWLVTDLSSPEDLGARLEKAGFTRSVEIAGMYLADLAHPITLNPAVQVHKAVRDDYETVSRLYQQAFPLDQAVADLFVDLLGEMGAAHHYLAYLDGIDEPVGAASMFCIRESSAVVLESAAVLEAYRGQGIYKNLVARRLADAQSDTMQVAVVQAFRTTSAPILGRLGFVERCKITGYEWKPKDAIDIANVEVQAGLN